MSYLFQSLKDFKGKSKFSTWLYIITFNTAVSKTRKKQVLTLNFENDHIDDVAYSGVTYQINVLKHSEQKRYINLALNKLKDDENLVTTLFYLNECSIEEIHEITGITISNIKVKLYRVRKKLYSELQLLLNNEVKSLL